MQSSDRSCRIRRLEMDVVCGSGSIAVRGAAARAAKRLLCVRKPNVSAKKSRSKVPSSRECLCDQVKAQASLPFAQRRFRVAIRHPNQRTPTGTSCRNVRRTNDESRHQYDSRHDRRIRIHLVQAHSAGSRNPERQRIAYYNTTGVTGERQGAPPIADLRSVALQRSRRFHRRRRSSGTSAGCSDAPLNWMGLSPSWSSITFSTSHRLPTSSCSR